MRTMTIEIEDEDGETVEHEVPSKNEVCWDCEGHGTVLREAIRNHCYTREEFEEQFSDEEQGEYFRRGGRYDVQCPTCRGKNVLEAPDLDRCTPEQKELLSLWEESQEEQARQDASDAYTRRMESGGY